MDLQQEAAFFYDFVYGIEGVEEPFDDWLPKFMEHFAKVIKGEEEPSDNLKIAMHIAYTRASTMQTQEPQDENRQCPDESRAEETSVGMGHADQSQLEDSDPSREDS